LSAKRRLGSVLMVDIGAAKPGNRPAGDFH